MRRTACDMRTNLPTTLLLAVPALLCSACTSTTGVEDAVQNISTGNTARNIRVIANNKTGIPAVALNDLADREAKSAHDRLECQVQSIRRYEAGVAWAQRVLKNGRMEINTPGAMLPACYAIHIVPVSHQVPGGAGTYFYDASTGALLGMTLYK